MDIWNGGQDGPGNDRSFRATTISYSETGLPGSWKTLPYARPGLPAGELTKGGSPGTGTWFAPSDPSVPFYARAKYVVFSGTNNYGMGDAYMMSEVRFYIYGGDVDPAGFPSPADSALGISTNPTLGWVPGASAAAHDVYFGTTFDSVNNAIRLQGDVNGDGKVDFLDFAKYGAQWQTTPSGLTVDLNDDGIVDLFDFDQTVAPDWLDTGNGIYKGHYTLNGLSFSPGTLQPGKTYYWRIDEVTSSNTWKGNVWSFMVQGTTPAASTYYVATNGSDDNDGLTLSTPFKTIQKARDTIANCSGLPAGGVTVYIRGGKYFLTSQMDFTSINSGAASSPIVYRAYTNETPRLIGGVQLDPSWFTVVTNGAAVLTRMPANYPNVYQCDLLVHGITDLGRLRSRGISFGETFYKGLVSHMELSCDGAMMQLARYPNSGYSTISTAPSATSFTYSGTPARESKWPYATDPWAHGFWNYDFYDEYLPISTFSPTANTINLDQAPGNNTITAGKRWRLVNLLEELDQAGEYYIETVAGNAYAPQGMLYFWPPGGSAAGKEIIVSTLGEGSKSLVKLNGASYVTFSGLTFEVSRFNAVEMQECNYVLLNYCTIRNVGNIGVRVEGGNSCGVQNSKVYGLGQGIGLSGGNRYTLTNGNHYARNNEIYDFGRWVKCYQPAIGLYGVGNEASNNQIYNGPHAAILFYQNNHLIQYNKVYNVVKESSDAGALYTYMGWATRGSSLKWNCIYDITNNVSGGTGVWGIYLDGYSSGMSLYGNILDSISSGSSGSAYCGAIVLNGGRDNAINNCVITYCSNAVTAGEWCAYPSNMAASQRSDVSQYNYQSPPWSTQYPTLAAIPATGDISSYAHPGGCSIVNNVQMWNGVWNRTVLINGQGDPFNSAYCTQSGNLNINPNYVDRANKFFAPQTYGGSERIPYEKIGVLHQTQASNPIPRNAATGISKTPVLYWGPAFGITNHKVYFGTTSGSLPLVSPGQSYSSYVPGSLSAYTTYYWRIDEVDGSGGVTTGVEWRFTTGP
jgi:hypothetical protein